MPENKNENDNGTENDNQNEDVNENDTDVENEKDNDGEPEEQAGWKGRNAVTHERRKRMLWSLIPFKPGEVMMSVRPPAATATTGT
jgi:hypothetical protein